MELAEEFLFGAGILAVIFFIIVILMKIVVVVGTIVLLCLSLKGKNELKLHGINENIIKRGTNLAVISLIICLLSCSGFWLLVLPILSLVFISNAKNFLNENNMVEAVKKLDLSFLLIVISNAVILGISALSFIGNVIGAIIGILD